MHALQGPFTVVIEVPYGTTISDVSGASATPPTVGNNDTLAINFTVPATLPAGAESYTFVNMSVLATSQVSLPRLLNLADCSKRHANALKTMEWETVQHIRKEVKTEGPVLHGIASPSFCRTLAQGPYL